MNKQAKNRNHGDAKASGLTFRRETIRILTEAESKRVQGGMVCTLESGSGDCRDSRCTTDTV